MQHLCTPGNAELVLFDRSTEEGPRLQICHILSCDRPFSVIKSAVSDRGSKDTTQDPLRIWNNPIGLIHQPVRQVQLYSPYLSVTGGAAPLS